MHHPARGVIAMSLSVVTAGAYVYWAHGLGAATTVLIGAAFLGLSWALHRERLRSSHLEQALGRETELARRVSDHAWHSELLSQVVDELRPSSDEASALQTATTALGSSLKASRVVLYGRDLDAVFRVRTQYVADGVLPIAADARLPALLASDPTLAQRLSQSDLSKETSPELRALCKRLQVRSTVVVPAGRHHMLTVDQLDDARSWSDVERRLIDRFADHLGAALARSEGQREQRETAEVGSGLLRVALALSEARESGAVAEIATSVGAPLSHARASALFVDHDGDGFRLCAQSGFEGSSVVSPVSSSVGPDAALHAALEDSLRARTPVRLDGRAPRIGGVETRAHGAILVVPLYHGREAMGVLALEKPLSDNPWPSDDVATAQKLAELTASALKNASLFEALAASEARYADLYDNAPDLYQTIDARGRIVDTNRTQCLSLGYEKDELAGIRFESLLAHESVSAWRRLETELFEKGYVRDASVRLRARDGRSVDVLLNASVIVATQAGASQANPSSLPRKRLSARVVMRDVGEFRRLEHQLRQSQKLEVVGTLAGGIAHDFNNLLGGILGYASLLEGQLRDRPRAQRYVETIERSALRGAELTGRLLAASRKSPMCKVPVDVNEVVEETLEILAHTFDKKVRIGKRLDPNVRPVLANAGQFQQIVLNLCVNARDAMLDGGLLRIETEFDARNQRLRLSVEDTGVGMEPSTIERLFEPFFSTKGERGTGLGLSVVYEIVKSMGGDVRVKSSPGEGARFDISVPSTWVDERRAQAGPAEPVDACRGRGELVLLVDDERVLRELGKEILETHGYRVHAVGGGEDALSFIRDSKERVALVILDLVMPGLDGGETYRRLRDSGAAVPVLLSSGLSSEEAVERILADGASGFIPKPYGIGELTRAVSAAIRNAEPPLMH
jgi:PAS domain S-box-containing protein